MHQTLWCTAMDVHYQFDQNFVKGGTFLSPQTFQSYFVCVLSRWEEKRARMKWQFERDFESFKVHFQTPGNTERMQVNF